MTRRLFIQAMNVHQGGGLALLSPLLTALPTDQQTVLLVDARARLPDGLPSNLHVHRVPPTLPKRWAAERWLRKQVASSDLLFCFGNLPPLMRSPGRVVVFLQNRYLVDPVPLATLATRTRLRLRVERAWLARCARNADAFVVQTPTMRRLCEGAIAQARGRTQVWPYAAVSAALPRSNLGEAQRDCAFIYPASADAHKNHRRLVEAWVLLAREGLRPSLELTYDAAAHPALEMFIDTRRREHRLSITNLGVLAHQDLMARYRQADALIYPSLLESFGLPLIEAAAAGLPVVAAELDYVRDILDPVQAFDPLSPVSIARAVKRFLGQGEADLGLMGAAAFLSRLLATSEASPASETISG